MNRNITVPTSWNQLNLWQLSEIAHLYLHSTPEDFSSAYQKMIFVLFRNDDSKIEKQKLRAICEQIPISELEKHAAFLRTSTNLSVFPDIEGLIKPAPRIGDITAWHFSVIENFFYQWSKSKSELNLKQLVASIYRLNQKFDTLDLPKVDAITRVLPIKVLEAVALSYLFIRRDIEKLFPIVFPEKKKEEKDDFKPVFKKEETYISFDKVIVSMSMDELQPLGKKQDVNEVRIYEFLSVLTESILYHKQKQKANERK